jgi:hypothetical protein
MILDDARSKIFIVRFITKKVGKKAYHNYTELSTREEHDYSNVELGTHFSPNYVLRSFFLIDSVGNLKHNYDVVASNGVNMPSFDIPV